MPIPNALLKLIEQNSPDVEGLDLTQSGITDDDIELLVDAMQNNTNLRSLKLSNDSFEVISTPWGMLIQSGDNTENNNSISLYGATLLAGLTTLEVLDISGNPIGDVGADSLAHSTSIRKLIANDCDITIAGKFKFLANKSLIALSVEGDKLSPDSTVDGYDMPIDEIVQLFVSVDPGIDGEILRASLVTENVDLKIQMLNYLNEKHGTGFHIENVIFSDYKNSLIRALYGLWSKQIEEVLFSNLQSYDPEAFQKKKLHRENEVLEDAIREAVDQENLADLTRLIPQLPEGINTYLVYGCTVLQCAVDANKPRIVEFLLDHGASLEVHAREYTPLFYAAQEGHYEAFKMLLNRGANITGEFYFNAETAFSIAAFKMNEKLFHILIRYKNYIEKLPQPCQKIAAEHQTHWKTLGWADLSKRPNEQISECDHTDSVWDRFGKDPTLTGEYSVNAIILQNNLTMLAKRLNDQELQIDLQRLTELANIYRLMHDKIAVIDKQKLLHEKNYFAAVGEQKVFQLHALESVDNNPQVANLAKAQMEAIVAQLNEELKHKKESDIDWSHYPKLFVAQYRGLHYYRHYFDDNQRRDHIFTSHLNRVAPAPAVYSMTSLLPTAHQKARESVLNENVQDLRDTLESFKHSGPVAVGGTTYQSVNAQLQELMSNNYVGYKDAVTKKQTPATQILFDKKAIGYPHYATSDLPQHTLRYGFGKKQIASLSQHRLHPDYDQTGKPKNQYLGKIYICLFTPLAMYRHRMQHVLGQHNRGLFNLKPTVAPERETGAPGGVESGYVFYEAVLQVPDFTEWKDEYRAEFGMDSVLFNIYRADLMQAKLASDRATKADKIIDFIIAHKEQQLLSLAQEAARQRGGYLIYRHNDREYGLTPEPIRGASYGVPLAETNLIQKVGDQRFNLANTTNAAAQLAIVPVAVHPSVLNPSQRKREREADHEQHPDLAPNNSKRPNNSL